MGNLNSVSLETIAGAFASYLLTSSPRKSESSQKIDRRVLAIAQHFFEKVLGLTLMSEVGLEHLEQFEIWTSSPQVCGEISKEPWSSSSILRHGKTIKTIFRKAFLTGRIPRDPTALWKLSAGEEAARRPMTDEEFDRLLELAPDWYKPVLRFLAATGARGSSVARLRWSDVEESNGALFLTSRKGGVKREKRNPFPITAEVQEILNILHRCNDFVFTKDGLSLTPELISMTGHKLIKRAGFQGVVLYGLRHKFCTDLLKAGTPTQTVARAMGHSTVMMVEKYSKKLGLDVLEKAIANRREKK